MTEIHHLYLELIGDGSDSEGRFFNLVDCYYQPVKNTRHVVDYKYLEAERARSAKLIEALHRCASPYSSSEKENVAREAIAEYEANRE